MKENEFSNIAVLIDPENISYKYLQKIFESIAAYGQISVRRIYSDWTDTQRNAWKRLIHEFSLVAIQQFSNKDSKNVSDFALVIDAMDLLHEGIFDCFCIVSSDSDFTRLAQRIREKGKTVIGLGERKAIKAFVNACNEFIYLNDNLMEDTDNKTDKEEIKNNIEEPLDVLMSKAVENLPNQDGWVQMNKIIPYLKQIKPDFDLSNYVIGGKIIKRLGNYFKNKKEYELDKDNTIVRKTIN
ncbi:MAG: NYN domain-containing protein [Treponema sp.]|jgi:uncharacterized protein (TIGR00288 family)|nr:NYN domain-containing protein [Treponema sp.]